MKPLSPLRALARSHYQRQISRADFRNRRTILIDRLEGVVREPPDPQGRDTTAPRKRNKAAPSDAGFGMTAVPVAHPVDSVETPVLDLGGHAERGIESVPARKSQTQFYVILVSGAGLAVVLLMFLLLDWGDEQVGSSQLGDPEQSTKQPIKNDSAQAILGKAQAPPVETDVPQGMNELEQRLAAFLERDIWDDAALVEELARDLASKPEQLAELSEWSYLSEFSDRLNDQIANNRFLLQSSADKGPTSSLKLKERSAALERLAGLLGLPVEVRNGASVSPSSNLAATGTDTSPALGSELYRPPVLEAEESPANSYLSSSARPSGAALEGSMEQKASVDALSLRMNELLARNWDRTWLNDAAAAIAHMHNLSSESVELADYADQLAARAESRFHILLGEGAQGVIAARDLLQQMPVEFVALVDFEALGTALQLAESAESPVASHRQASMLADTQTQQQAFDRAIQQADLEEAQRIAELLLSPDGLQTQSERLQVSSRILPLLTDRAEAAITVYEFALAQAIVEDAIRLGESDERLVSLKGKVDGLISVSSQINLVREQVASADSERLSWLSPTLQAIQTASPEGFMQLATDWVDTLLRRIDDMVGQSSDVSAAKQLEAVAASLFPDASQLFSNRLEEGLEFQSRLIELKALLEKGRLSELSEMLETTAKEYSGRPDIAQLDKRGREQQAKAEAQFDKHKASLAVCELGAAKTALQVSVELWSDNPVFIEALKESSVAFAACTKEDKGKSRGAETVKPSISTGGSVAASPKKALLTQATTVKSSSQLSRHSCDQPGLGRCRDELREFAAPWLVKVPPGEYTMGNKRYPNERPVRQITFRKGFAIGRFETSYDEFSRYCKETGVSCPSNPWGEDGMPVVGVSFEAASRYAAWLSTRTGHVYRLPSEAEWEYAARAGSTGDNPFTGTLNNGFQARFESNGPVLAAGKDSFIENGFDLRHVIGNVQEWVLDTWDDDLASTPQDGAPRTDGDATLGVVRGGHFADKRSRLRVSMRASLARDLGNDRTGFRLLRQLD